MSKVINVNGEYQEIKDVVEVTRWKDCEHYDPIHIRPFLGTCDVWNTVVKECGFCHHGERKDNEL